MNKTLYANKTKQKAKHRAKIEAIKAMGGKGTQIPKESQGSRCWPK